VKRTPHQTADYSIIALKFIAFIASDETRLERFTALTGLSPQECKERALDKAFQGFVLDFAMQDESAMLEFAAQEEISPESIIKARFALPGANYDF
jgi:hypothetical protein